MTGKKFIKIIVVAGLAVALGWLVVRFGGFAGSRLPVEVGERGEDYQAICRQSCADFAGPEFDECVTSCSAFVGD